VTLKKRKKQEPHRARLSGDQFAQRDQVIWQMRADGHTVQHIADTMECGLATVDRALKRLVARRRRLSPDLDLEAEMGAEVDAALSEYVDQSMKGQDARSAEDVMGLNALEYYRLCHLPAEHPAQKARAAAHETGWKMMPND
jgi:hypothetical protein